MAFSRRNVLLISLATASSCWLGLVRGAAQNPTGGRRQTDPSQEDPQGTNLNFPANANKTLLEERQKSIKKDVEKLYGLASELKHEVEKTDSTTVLSVAMLKKAEEIEKLAKQIRDRAKG